MSQPRTITLRGYVIEREPDRHIGVCLTLNLVVEGPSQDEATRKLHELTTAYLQDAFEKRELHQFVPRRAPLSFYGEYCLLRVRTLLHNIFKRIDA